MLYAVAAGSRVTQPARTVTFLLYYKTVNMLMQTELFRRETAHFRNQNTFHYM